MSLEKEPEVQRALDQLTTLLQDNEVVQRYQNVKARIDQNTAVHTLEEAIKQAQKEAVHFAHYGKPEAEKQALKRADELTKQLEEHPLVIAYRESLSEANDLLQHLTGLIQKEINDAIEDETKHD
ncbi:hypothetical protein NRIC_36650 [Enterococcus florum]|uniref:Cell fate regulator YmcA, YheA/YmcA/DUF963 family (Controls sporulation, competence, biofilm development) n=1 Tax=Enterococcus florum TaxID=2480627 RepID=A0A4P5PG72_9ENTE|nr:YlbF family regulator [Enterococcus florum]GCF95774.1 hypothetical protein NRIC_36650 [Enterococcus florum]